MLESTIEQAFVKYSESLGYEAFKLRIDGKNGWMDRTVFTEFGVIVFEFKQLKGRARKMQLKWAEYLQGLGYQVHWPRRIGEAEAILDRWLEDGRNKIKN